MEHRVTTPPYAAIIGTAMGVLHTSGVYSRIATEKICCKCERRDRTGLRKVKQNLRLKSLLFLSLPSPLLSLSSSSLSLSLSPSASPQPVLWYQPRTQLPPECCVATGVEHLRSTMPMRKGEPTWDNTFCKKKWVGLRFAVVWLSPAHPAWVN